MTEEPGLYEQVFSGSSPRLFPVITRVFEAGS
jgi:hypothetical protein